MRCMLAGIAPSESRAMAELEDVEWLHDTIDRLHDTIDRVTAERDAARAALRWLAGRYVDCGGSLATRDGFTRYGGGVTDHEWTDRVTPHLGEAPGDG
jgi:hypothetical protein